VRARILGSGLTSYLGDLMLRNVIANLAEDVEVGSCWFDFFVFHTCRVAGSKLKPTLFCFFCGMAVTPKHTNN
jgi:hypothetical protein